MSLYFIDIRRLGPRGPDRKLAEQRFNVVVVGEFKRGKTTFVNALLGSEVLPSAVVPLTSVVTAVAWGGEIRAGSPSSTGACRR